MVNRVLPAVMYSVSSDSTDTLMSKRLHTSIENALEELVVFEQIVFGDNPVAAVFENLKPCINVIDK